MAKKKYYKRRNKSFSDSFFNSVKRSARHALYATMVEQNGGKPDKWAALGIGLGTGSVKNTKDLAHMGAWLGAMGAFDDDNSYTHNVNNSNKILFPETSKKDDSWKLEYLIEGAKYGLEVDDYASKDKFMNDLLERKQSGIESTKSINTLDETPQVNKSTPVVLKKWKCCNVKLISNSEYGSYITDNPGIEESDVVKVNTKNGDEFGIVMDVKELNEDEINNFKSLPRIIE